MSLAFNILRKSWSLGFCALLINACSGGGESLSANVSSGRMEITSGVNFQWEIPSDATSLMIHHHGTGGSETSSFAPGEGKRYKDTMVASKIGFVALDSADRTTKQWDSSFSTTNVDVVNERAVIDYLVSNGIISSSLPKFSSGMSNGGGFAAKPALYSTGYIGLAIHCAGGAGSGTANIPTIFEQGQYDNTNEHTDFPATTTQQTNMFDTAGTRYELHVNQPHPVTVAELQKIEGMSESLAQSCLNSLIAGGNLDSNGNVLNFTNFNNNLPAEATALRGLISDRVKACGTYHQLDADTSQQVADFLLSI